MGTAPLHHIPSPFLFLFLCLLFPLFPLSLPVFPLSLPFFPLYFLLCRFSFTPSHAPLSSPVKLSNMMRVLGDQMVQDPTRVEAMVREQMAERLATHQAANEARKLTAEERRDKHRLKAEADRATGLIVAVFRIEDLSHPQQKFRVDRNAAQLGLTGVAVVTSEVAMVVAEGGAKGIKQYKKLMLRRIKWNPADAATATQNDDDSDDDDEEEEEGQEEEDNKAVVVQQTTPQTTNGKANRCALVWEGSVKADVFRNFRVRDFSDEAAARAFLRRFGVEHYWDHTRNYVDRRMF